MVKGSTLVTAGETVQIQPAGGLAWAGLAPESRPSGRRRCPHPSCPTALCVGPTHPTSTRLATQP